MTRAGERLLMGVAERNNRRRAITGALIATGRHYLQILEGPHGAIAELLPKVELDDRHYDVRTLLDRTVPTRMYPTWSMGYLFNLDLADELAELHRGASHVVPDDLFSRFQPDDFVSSAFGGPSSFGGFDPGIDRRKTKF